MIRKLSEFILFGSVFISLCAVAMCIETNLLLHLKLNSISFYSFVFGATLVQYNLHYIVKKSAVQNSLRLSWSLKSKQVHKALILAGFAMIIVSLFSFRLHHLIFLSVLGVIAFLYSFPFLPNKKRIKDLGLLKIITLSLLWTLVTVWFPADQLNFSGFTFQLIFFRRFIFMFVLCLLFDIRDAEVDRSENISTLAVVIGTRRSYILCYILLLAFVLLSLVQFLHVADTAQLACMLISAAATAFTIEFSKKNSSDIIYLALVDGMMLLQALLVIFASQILKSH